MKTLTLIAAIITIVAGIATTTALFVPQARDGLGELVLRLAEEATENRVQADHIENNLLRGIDNHARYQLLFEMFLDTEQRLTELEEKCQKP